MGVNYTKLGVTNNYCVFCRINSTSRATGFVSEKDQQNIKNHPWLDNRCKVIEGGWGLFDPTKDF